MANEEHLKILKQGVEAWNKWRRIYPTMRPDLIEANLWEVRLCGMDLRGVDFTWAYLRLVDFRGALLYAANLTRTNLFDANLSRTLLDDANLTEADLQGANFTNAVLNGANFQNAKVGGTVFADIDLSSAKGLDTVVHQGSSTIGIDTLYKSKGKIPEVFLRGCGVPDQMIAFIATLAGQPETYRTRLRMMIDQCFNKSELQTLCFDLTVDYDILNGENKSDKARELVAYFQRRGAICDLVAKCQELRPNVSWEGEYE